MPIDAKTGALKSPCCFASLFLQRGDKHNIASSELQRNSSVISASSVLPGSKYNAAPQHIEHPRAHYECGECGRLYVLFTLDGELAVVPCSECEGIVARQLSPLAARALRLRQGEAPRRRRRFCL
jgi:DNA-directed RNA polymerase subunit RPC12/RpoP